MQGATEPEALKNNIIDEVVDPKESLDKIEEGNIKLHSSEIRGLCSTKCSSKTLQNLLYF